MIKDDYEIQKIRDTAFCSGYNTAVSKYEKRNKELEKENAELKADNDARKFAMAMSEKVEKQLREENEELKAKVCSSIDCEKADLEIAIRIGALEEENTKLKEQIEDLKCCANCKYEEQGYIQEPCKSCNRYFPTLKVGARDKWEKK